VSRCRHGDEASFVHPSVGDAAHGWVRLARGAWVCASVLAGDPREQFYFRGGEATEPILLDLLRKAAAHENVAEGRRAAETGEIFHLQRLVVERCESADLMSNVVFHFAFHAFRPI